MSSLLLIESPDPGLNSSAKLNTAKNKSSVKSSTLGTFLKGQKLPQPCRNIPKHQWGRMGRVRPPSGAENEVRQDHPQSSRLC